MKKSKLGSIMMLVLFPISVSVYCIDERNFYKGVIMWLEHVFEGFHGKFWERVELDCKSIRIKLF